MANNKEAVIREIEELRALTGLPFLMDIEQLSEDEIVMAKRKLKETIKAYKVSYSEEYYFKNLLLGHEQVKLNGFLGDAFIGPTYDDGRVYLIKVDGKDMASSLDVLKGVFPTNRDGLVLCMDDEHIVVIPATAEDKYPKEVGLTIVHMIQTEGMCQAQCSIGGLYCGMSEMKNSYEQARRAGEMGRLFSNGGDVVEYDDRFVDEMFYDMTWEQSERFLKQVFGDNIPTRIPSEELDLVHCFLEENLNVSETARQLFMHRNTLLHRLTKIKENYGYDIRIFKDAFTFKMVIYMLAIYNGKGLK